MLRIGTRKSPLALAQATLVGAMLPGVEVEIIPMTTTGDQLAGSLADAGGKGLFTKELEEALFSHSIDIAVHSAKDMQTLLPPGLALACVPQREDVRDVLITPSPCRGEGWGGGLHALPPNAILGTSSLRRSAQALHLRPDLKIVTLRGNVQTRLLKIEKGEAAATLLALAGLKRLGISPLPGAPLSVDEILPAVAQGALGIECREDDAHTQALLAPLNHAPSMAAVICERAMLRALDGNCRTPIAGLATLQNGTLHLRGMLCTPDGKQCWKVDERGEAQDAARLGKEAGEKLSVLSAPSLMA